MAVLRTNNLHKQYQLGEVGINALSGIDFAVDSGEFVAIMGPSGSGKSTLLHLLGGLDTPSEGQILLSDQVFSDLPDREMTITRRRRIGFVFQFFNLLPTLTAEENISLPLMIDGQQPEKFQGRIDRLLFLVGLEDRRDHKPDQLSGGEQQRVALARALVTEPEILLADEPTGNLDSKAGARVMSLLRRSSDELGQTVVVVTHDPRAAAYADRVVYLRDGQQQEALDLSSFQELSQRVREIMTVMERLET